jgi:hypothetical protein
MEVYSTSIINCDIPPKTAVKKSVWAFDSNFIHAEKE